VNPYDTLITSHDFVEHVRENVPSTELLRIPIDPFDGENDPLEGNGNLPDILLLFARMALCPDHTFQIVTARPERMAEFLANRNLPGSVQVWMHELDYPDRVPIADWFEKHPLTWPLPNVWLGVTVENQEQADARVPHLLRCPAAVRFLSCEPLLGDVDLTNVNTMRFTGAEVVDALSGEAKGMFGDPAGTVQCLHWLIVGGESGPRARPCDVAWVRSVVRQGEDAGVPVYVTRLGARAYEDHPPREKGGVTWRTFPTGNGLANRDPNGADPDEWPADLRVRAFPEREGAGS